VFYVIAMIGLLGWPSSVYLFSQARRRSLTEWQMLYMAAALTTALAMSVAIWLLGMRSGVRALQDMDRTPA
jgi:hypothetical protein